MVCNPWAVFEAYFEAKALHPKTNKFVGVRSLKAYRGLPCNAGLPFLVCLYFTTRQKRNKQATSQIYILKFLFYRTEFPGDILWFSAWTWLATASTISTPNTTQTISSGSSKASKSNLKGSTENYQTITKITFCPVCWLLYLVIKWKENVQRTNVSTQTFCINFVLWINTYYCWKNQYLFDIIFESVTDVAGLIVNGSEPLYKKVNEISRQEAAVHLCFTHINYSSELPVVRCALWVR